jgi:tetratricopeptide (TPR) repeat protein
VTNRPRISLCVIARDEEAFIGGCLDSAAPYVDELVVLDTGSVDRTVEIAREHGARIERFTWVDDFAAARNAAINAATGDWVLMLDADERLVPESGPLLRTLAASLPDGAHGYRVLILNRTLGDTPQEGGTHTIARFFPRLDDVRYVGAIHEDLAFRGRPEATVTVDGTALAIVHFGYDEEVVRARDKVNRNLRLLELELERAPTNPQTLFYAARQQVMAGDHRRATELMESFLAYAAGLPFTFTVEAYRMLIACAIELGDGIDVLVERATRARALSPEALDVLASHAQAGGRFETAEGYLLRALDPSVPRGAFEAPGAGSWRTRLHLAHVYEQMGDVTRALATLERCFEEAPEAARHRAALSALVLAIHSDQRRLARDWRERALATTPDELQLQSQLFDLSRSIGRVDEDVDLWRLDGCIAVVDWQQAYETAGRLALGTQAALVRMRYVAERLAEGGAHDAALDVLNRVLDAYPPSRETLWLLVQVLTRAERYDDALAATNILQELAA